MLRKSFIFIILFICLTGFSRHGRCYAQDSFPLSATLQGTVTSAVTGLPVIGARITVNSQSTYSVSAGVYSILINPPGTYTVSVEKTGYDLFTSQPITFTQGSAMVLNVFLWETTNPPGPAIAILDTALQTVFLSWEIPGGNYELLYDDGIQENFTLWATQGNMNAVKFTPVAYPASVKGGSVHIGEQSNYPGGSNPFVPFQVAVYDASGANGMPGNLIGGPFDVIPAQFGWNEFMFPSVVTINSGNFYLVMIQGGNAPNAAGLAVDQTINQFRSVNRFITGGAPWMPAGGNFMMRAVMFGPGGPVPGEDFPDNLLQYEVWRLRQGEEQNPGIWTSLGTTPDPFLSDPSWFFLSCGPYRWGVKAGYSSNRWSPVSFSNVLGKCWTTAITIDVNLTCANGNQAGTSVSLKNIVYPDTAYSAILDTSGVCLFPNVWKGTYGLTVNRFMYQPFCDTLPLSADSLISVLLLQKKPPPSNLQVNNKSLVAQWNVPVFRDTLFSEDWSSGSFTSQGWTLSGGYNWVISNTQGNPLPSAMFGWSPQVMNYSQSLTSASISGEHAAMQHLWYDISLDNFGTTTLNQMAVEIWDGMGWTALKNYTNANGNIPWTTEIIDISAYTDMVFQIRYRAYGEDSYDLNGWYIDNIRVEASESEQALTACILGYNFYLDNILSGFTPVNTYVIPGIQVQYGQTYLACVQAAYGSGFSPKSCTQFTSSFLFPPRDLAGTQFENTVFLEWLKPSMADSGSQQVTPPGLLGYRIYRNDSLISYIAGPDSLTFYDTDLEPGTYVYLITAWYDLTLYGFAGQYDESVEEGPVSVIMSFGLPLPFFESWDQATFTYHNWRFTPEQGNWIIDVTAGNPLPEARFTWDPVRQDYAYSLESPVLDASPFTCASIWLDFDLKLEDQDSTGEERLLIQVYYDNIWHKITEFTNSGSFEWDMKHLEISAVIGKGFRVGFLAMGTSSDGILNWQLDNIHVYGICYPPENLQGEAMGYDVHLTWSPPQCAGSGMLLDEGFEGLTFPPPNWEIQTFNQNGTWERLPASSQVGVHSGNYSAGVLWDYAHQDEWLIARNVLVNGNLRFWSFAYQGSVQNDHYYVKVSPDQGASWSILLDLSTLPVYPSPSGYNQWEIPYDIDMNSWMGLTVDLAWQALDDQGQGLWHNWAIDDCYMGSDEIDLCTENDMPDNRSLSGYHVFRKDPGSQNFLRITQEPWPDTTFIDPALPPGEFLYFVLPVFPECSQTLSSDTIGVDVITGREEHSGDSIRIFPNPASEAVIISSSRPISQIILIDIRGNEIFNHELKIPGLSVPLDVSTLPPGIFILKVITDSMCHSGKLVIGK